MSRAPAIARRELSSYFFSPIAYVALALFVLASDVAFLDDFTPGQPAEMRHIFQWMVWLLVFIIPILSMGLMAQEWATGTIESLMTAPVSETDVVLGKFLGSLSFFGVLIAPTLLFPVMLSLYGHVDTHAIACGYVGIVLVGDFVHHHDRPLVGCRQGDPRRFLARAGRSMRPAPLRGLQQGNPLHAKPGVLPGGHVCVSVFDGQSA